MNFKTQMLPGIVVLLSGAVLTFFAEKLCRKKEAVNLVRLIGVGLGFIGAILAFLP